MTTTYTEFSTQTRTAPATPRTFVTCPECEQTLHVHKCLNADCSRGALSGVPTSIAAPRAWTLGGRVD